MMVDPLVTASHQYAVDAIEVAMIGTFPRIERHSPSATFEERLRGTGNNTGNLAFAVAAHEQICAEKAYYGWDFDPDALNRRHKRAVLVCANMVNPHLDLAPLAAKIERLRIPFCAFSMGVQAPLYQSASALRPGTDRFLRVASERAVSLGVRGKTTAAVLDGMGIHNWRIVGCPSNFLNLGTTFVDYNWQSMAARVGGILGVHLEYVGPFAAYVAQCRRLVAEAPHLFFVQSPFGLLKSIVDAQAGEAELHPHAMTWMAPFGASSLADARDLLRDKFRCFFSFGDWISAMAKLRFSFGARLHGNIVALQCGVPALVVAHDERTRELAECLALPNILFNDFLSLNSMTQAVAIACEGMVGYATRRQELAREYVGMLTDNGLVPSVGLRAVAGVPEGMNGSGRAPVVSPPAIAPAMRSEFIGAVQGPRYLNRIPPDSAGEGGPNEDGRADVCGGAKFLTQVQPWPNTGSDRYPEIFTVVSNFTRQRHSANFKVLSYGCSTGEEPRTLAQLYFPGCVITGLDVSETLIATARQRSSGLLNVTYDISTDHMLENHGPYDVIFAMSVFCRWPESRDMDSIHGVFPFEHYQERISVLDKSLRPGGLLILANANYNFLDTTSSSDYDVIMSPLINTNGFVKHFDRSSAATRVAATDCIYRKREQVLLTGPGRIIRVFDEGDRLVGSIGRSD